MANTVIGASVEIEYRSVGNMRKALKEANEELIAMKDQFGDTSKEAIAAAKKVAELKDKIDDARETADLFDPGKKFQAFVTLGSQIAAGFSAVQGAMALVGSESEDLQKALLKVQGAMALAQGLSELKDFGKSWQQLNVFIQSSSVLIKANAAANSLAAGAMRMFGVAVNTTSTSFKVLKGAIVSTGIGALVVLLGEAVSALMNFADSTDEAAAADEKLKKSEERLAQAIEIKNKAINGTIDALNNVTQLNILRARLGGASEDKLTDIERKGIEERIKIRKAELDKSSTDQAGYFEMLKKYGDDINELEKFNLNAQIKQRDDANKKSQASNNEALQKRREAEEKRKQIIEQANEAEKQANIDLIKFNLSARENELFDLKLNYEKQKKLIEDGGKSSASLTELYNKQKDAINKKYAEEQRKREIEFLNEYNKIIEDIRLAGITDVREKEQDQLKISYEEQRATILENEELTEIQKAKLLLALTEKYEVDVLNLKNKYREEDLTKQKEYNEKLVDADNQLYAAKWEAANAAFGLLSSLAGNNEKLQNAIFAVEKAVSIAKIIIDTQKEIAGYYAANSAIPGVGVAIATKLALAAKIRAGASIAAIVATTIGKYKKGGGTQPTTPTPNTTPGMQSTAPLTPALSPAVQGQMLNSDAINNLGNTALRAYVMNSDIQNNDQRNAYLQRNARIG